MKHPRHYIWKFGYYLYTRTVIGRILHNRQCRKSRKDGAHTNVEAMDVGSDITVVSVPMLDTNYGYLLIDSGTGHTAAVDPCDADTMAEAFAMNQQLWQSTRGVELKLQTVLTTHYHHDHAGGNLKMAKLFPGVNIVAGHLDNSPGATSRLQDREHLQLGRLKVTVLFTPGHTKGHVMFLCGVEDSTAQTQSGMATSQQCPVLFTGDCLFVGGVGKFFEGTAEQMHRNLVMLGEGLPSQTLIFPGHEYTLENLLFASWVEKENEKVTEKLQWTIEKYRDNHQTIPSTLGAEKDHNPFFRWESPEIVDSIRQMLPEALPPGTETPAPEHVVGALRRMKDLNMHRRRQ